MNHNIVLSSQIFLLFYRVIVCLNIVVLDKSSAWLKKPIKSMKASKKSLQIVTYEKMEPSCPSPNKNSQKRVLIVPPSCASKGLPSSSKSPEIGPNERPASVREEEPSPPKKRSLSFTEFIKQTGDGTVPECFMNHNISKLDGKATSPLRNSLGSFGPFGQPITSLPSTRIFNFEEPNIHRTQPILGNSSFAADLPASSFSSIDNHAQSTAKCQPNSIWVSHHPFCTDDQIP